MVGCSVAWWIHGAGRWLGAGLCGRQFRRGNAGEGSRDCGEGLPAGRCWGGPSEVAPVVASVVNLETCPIRMKANRQ